MPYNNDYLEDSDAWNEDGFVEGYDEEESEESGDVVMEELDFESTLIRGFAEMSSDDDELEVEEEEEGALGVDEEEEGEEELALDDEDE
jgi:hypothetical protein